MRYETTVELAAPADRVWSVLADLWAWPDWTPTVETLSSDSPTPHVGMVVTLKQPRRRRVRYTIDVVDPGRRFRWGSDRHGVRQLADHVLTPTGPSSCTLQLSFAMNGPVGAVLGIVGSSQIRRMVDTEGQAFRQRLTRSS